MLMRNCRPIGLVRPAIRTLNYFAFFAFVAKDMESLLHLHSSGLGLAYQLSMLMCCD